MKTIAPPSCGHEGPVPKHWRAWDATTESPAVLFNRGMARLFLGQIAEAREWLQKAIDAIPEASGWNALARLYLAVAEIHG